MGLFPFFQTFRFPILQNQPSLCKWQNIILRLHPPFLTYATSSVIFCLQEPVHPTPLHTSQKSSPSPFPVTGCHCLSLNSPQIICITLRFSYSFLKLAFPQLTLTSEESKHLCHLCMQQCAEQRLAYGKCTEKHLWGREHMTILK